MTTAQTLAKQMHLVNYIDNFTINTKDKKSPSILSECWYKMRLELLETYWNEFVQRHKLLMEKEAELEKEEYLTKDQYFETEGAYSLAKADILTELKKFKTTVPPSTDINASQPTATEVNTIPKTILPTFNGKQSEWETFKKVFCSVIKDKPNVSSVLKLQHLMSCVDGSAAKRLKGMKMIGSNFEVTWDKLVRRYDNPKRRLATHLDSLINLKPASRKNVEEINSLFDTVDEAIQGLKDLQCPVDSWDQIIVHCIVRKLDPSTRETWEIAQEIVEGFPTYKSLSSFLEKRVQSLEQAHGPDEK